MNSLSAFGIPEERIIVITKPTQFKKIIIPDQSAVPLAVFLPYEFTDKYVQVFRHIKKQITPAKHKKVYLSRSLAARKNVFGEEYFIDFFRKRGFKIINPEEYTMKEKAEIMYGADEVVTVDGTNAHLSIFCKPSVRLTILSRVYNGWSSAQQLINEVAGIQVCRCKQKSAVY